MVCSASPLEQAAAQQGQYPVTVGIRAQDFVLNPVSDLPEAQVKLVEVTGESSLLHVEWQGFPLHVQFAGRVTVEPGQAISLGINSARLHLFDAQNGQRLAIHSEQETTSADCSRKYSAR